MPRHARAVRRSRALLPCLVVLSLADRSWAQCLSNASSCVTCHETEARHPVLGTTAPWHVEHGFGDLCAACHGGDPGASSRTAAHLGLQAPLGNADRTCKACHGSDTEALAQRYLIAAADARSSPPAAPRGPVAPARSGPRADYVLALVAITLAGVLCLALRPRNAGNRWGFVAALRAASWSPLAAGSLLGVVVAVSEVAYARPIAAAGAFDKLAAYLGRWLFPTSQYYTHVMRPGVVWSVWVVLGIFIGAYASAKLSGTANKRWLPEIQWQARFGAARATRLAIAFLGAVLVQLGAGIAGGCTSGLAISGGALLSPAAFLFMGGMFAAGIPTAWLWYRKGGG